MGYQRVRRAQPRIPRAHRGGRLRAGGSAGSHRHAGGRNWKRAARKSENQYVALRDARRQRSRRSSIMDEVFEVTDRKWRGIGPIPASGYRLRAEFAAFDAERVFGVATRSTPRSRPNASRPLVLQGLKKPRGLPGVRHALHARAPAGRAHGFERRRLRRLLRLPPPHRYRRRQRMTLRLPRAARRRGTPCCWATAAAAS